MTKIDDPLKIPGFPTEFEPVTSYLAEPEEGEEQLDHSKDWVKADEIICGARDVINEVIAKINELAAMVDNPLPILPLPELPGGTMADYLIKPFAGDYGKIRQNSNACASMSKGMDAWSNNFLYISQVIPEEKMAGATADGFKAHCTIYALVIRGFSLLVGKAALVFDSIALASEGIAVELEKVIIDLAEILGRLAKTIAKRFSGLLGLLELGLDVLRNGFGVITDVVDDITKGIKLINDSMELKDLVIDWVEVEVDRLKSFDDIADVIQKLPETGAEVIREQQITPTTREEINKILKLIDKWSESEEEKALAEKLLELGLLTGDGEDADEEAAGGDAA